MLHQEKTRNSLPGFFLFVRAHPAAGERSFFLFWNVCFRRIEAHDYI
jgi:hypothetical protein